MRRLVVVFAARAGHRWWPCLPRPGPLPRRPRLRVAAPCCRARRTWPAPASALQVGSKGHRFKVAAAPAGRAEVLSGARSTGNFGTSTLEAVWAFYEVQGLPVHSYVDSAMKWRAGSPEGAAAAGPARRGQPDRGQTVPRDAGPVAQQQGAADQPRVDRRPLLLLLPRRRCGVAITPTGKLPHDRVHARLGARAARRDVQPSFFIGTAFAIHCDTDVPLAPVSHCCVRIPYGHRRLLPQADQGSPASPSTSV